MSKNDHEVVPRSEYEYRQEVKAEAVALTLCLGNCSQAAREMAKRYPDRSPGRDLIWRWASKLEPEAFSQLQHERKEEFSNRVVDLALLSADKLEEEIEAGNIKAQGLAVTWGINADKALKLKELDARGSSPSGFAAVAALISRVEKEMMADGSGKISETRLAIAAEGELP
jgi:hypothetical protein